MEISCGKWGEKEPFLEGGLRPRLPAGVTLRVGASSRVGLQFIKKRMSCHPRPVTLK